MPFWWIIVFIIETPVQPIEICLHNHFTRSSLMPLRFVYMIIFTGSSSAYNTYHITDLAKHFS